jgi:acyl-CoA reductase-like NAD-dependent aldehyde dehydrogenase
VAALEPFEQFLQHPRGLVIAGTERPAASGHWFDVQNPATGQRLATVADSGPADVDAAVEAARAAELAREALDSYLQTKTVWIDLS